MWLKLLILDHEKTFYLSIHFTPTALSNCIKEIERTESKVQNFLGEKKLTNSSFTMKCFTVEQHGKFFELSHFLKFFHHRDHKKNHIVDLACLGFSFEILLQFKIGWMAELWLWANVVRLWMCSLFSRWMCLLDLFNLLLFSLNSIIVCSYDVWLLKCSIDLKKDKKRKKEKRNRWRAFKQNAWSFRNVMWLGYRSYFG